MSTLTQLPAPTLLAESVALAESLLHRWLSAATEKPEPPTPSELQPAIHSLWKLSLIRKNLSPSPDPDRSHSRSRNLARFSSSTPTPTPAHTPTRTLAPPISPFDLPPPSTDPDTELSYLESGLTYLENELDALERADPSSVISTSDPYSDDEYDSDEDADADADEFSDDEGYSVQAPTRILPPDVPVSASLEQLRMNLLRRKNAIFPETRPPPG